MENPKQKLLLPEDIALIIWFDTKEIRTSVIALSTGIGVVLIGVFILNLIGYY